MPLHDYHGCLSDVLHAIRSIQCYCNGKTFEDYLVNKQLRDAVERNSSILGEALVQAKRHYPEVERDISNLRQITCLRSSLMNTTHRHIRTVAVAAFVFIALAEIFVLQQPLFQRQPELKRFAIASDISIVLPVLLFFGLHLWFPLKLSRLFSFIAMGVFISSVLTGTKLWIFAVLVEMILTVLVLIRLKNFGQQVQQQRQQGATWQAALWQGARASLITLSQEPLMRYALTEMRMLHYSLLGFWRRPSNALQTFAYYQLRDSTVLIGLGLMLLMESIPIHFLLHQWQPWLAWLATISNIYVLLWLIADYRAMQLKPLELYADRLVIHQGLRASVTVKLEHILSITPYEHDSSLNEEAIDLSCSKIPQLTLELTQEVEVQQLFRKNRTNILLLSVQDSEGLINALDKKL